MLYMYMTLKLRQKYLTTITSYFGGEYNTKTINFVAPGEHLVN